MAFSCTDEDLFRNEVHFRLENGGFVRFAGPFNALIGADDPSSWSYNELVEDVNNNLTSYDVYVIGGGDTTLVVSHANPTGQFGIGLTSTNVAAALGVDPSTFEFGQSIRFWATATRNDGVVFNATPLSADFTTGEVTGNTQEQLTTTAGYRNALTFSLIIACPSPPDVSSYVGTMNVITSSWFELGPVTVEAGPGANQITLKNLQGGSNRRIRGSSADFVLTLNKDQTVSFDRQEGWNDSGFNSQYGEYRFIQGAGSNFTFQCANNRITIRMYANVNAGNFGTSTMVLEK
tara:strand:- start:1010 stop:1882 length:873 start_codon:yes stop_codon:yes gene_type:complete